MSNGEGIPVTTEGGIAAKQAVGGPLPVLLAPTEEDRHNVVRVPLVPVACFRVEDLRFEFGSSVPTPEIRAELRNLGTLLDQNPDCPISVFGHADPVGEDTANKDLSGRRATAIYALLVRDPAMWEDLFRRPAGSDDWRDRGLQVMLDHVTGVSGQSTASHKADPARRRQLFTDYMDKVRPPTLRVLDKRTDFLARGADPGGKGDFQGCSEFNPVLVFSQQQHTRFDRSSDKAERNQTNAPNRRVVVFIFRKNSRVDPAQWPCPRAAEGIAGCRKRFWSDGESRRTRRLATEPRIFARTRDTFACRFYDRIGDRSPCEHIPPAIETAFHLHLDADRDGTVDDDRNGLDTWEFGAGKKGAIIVCNNDGDGAASRSDNADDAINAGNDRDEITPLVIRRTGPPAPADWKATLSVSAADKDRIRIFESRSTGAREVLGPRQGATFTFPDLAFAERELGMEAVRYAGTDFDGEITITFTLTKGAAGTETESGKVRVAPWVMPNHLDKAEKVFVVNLGSFNRRFIRELSGHVTAAGCTLQQHTSGDQWMQDCMEFGLSGHSGTGFRSVIRAPRNRPLKTFPRTLRKADLGYHEPGSLSPDTTFDSTGNLECTPPVTSRAGKTFPFGRIYFGPGRPGEELDADTKTFLEKQIVQAPIEIDTNWLLVGHVDEIISFVPAPGGKKFKLLLASPRLAYEILRDNQASNGSARMLVGRKFPDVSSRSAEVSIDDFLTTGIPSVHPRLAASHLEPYNDARQADLDAIRGQLESELGLEADDILEVPIIFADITVRDLADALTAGMVNMLVINDHCIFPTPFGPVVGGKDLFEDDLVQKLTALGLTPHSLDDWFEYHVLLGEVHCGTNTLRAPTSVKWWEFEP
jgi:protein-arginine deiminase